MTCKEYFIYGATTIEGTTKGLYHTDSYAKIQSEDLKEKLASKAEEFDAKVKEQEREIYDMAAIAKSLKL